MDVVILIHIFNGSVETYATVGGLCRLKGWSDSTFRKKSKGCRSFVYNEYRVEISEVRNDREPKGGDYSHLRKK